MTHEEQCGKDTLRDIHRSYKAASELVVRWCYRCGAVVVDEDYDGRTNPGAYLQMQFPETVKMELVKQELSKR